MSQTESAVVGLHDFDFLVGAWHSHHRKLKLRLANNHEWTGFNHGTLVNQALMGGYSNEDDTVLGVPDAPYRGVALRSFDTKTASGCGPSGGWTAGRHPHLRIRR